MVRSGRERPTAPFWGMASFLWTSWLLVSLVAPDLAIAQDLRESPPVGDKTLRLGSILIDATSVLARPGLTPEERRSSLSLAGVVVDDVGRAHVEIVAPHGSAPIGRDFVQRFEGRFDRAFANLTDAWIPVERLREMAAALPDGFFMNRAQRPALNDVTGQGPAVMNSASYRDSGAAGANITIAIIDGGYNDLSGARNNGDAPSLSQTTLINYTPDPFEWGTTHGTACVETAYDHAPQATWRLYRIDSAADVGAVVSDAIASGVDIISHSLGWFNYGWVDDSGPICQAAASAADAGILFVSAAGNSADAHWQGNFDPGSDGDQWHQWSARDETIDIWVGPGDWLDAFLSWDTAGGTYDLDLYLYDDQGNVLKSSTAGGNTYEEIKWQNTTGSLQTVELAVYRFAGGTTEMEVFIYPQRFLEHAVAAGSTSTPANCTHPGVISVGAVHWSLYPTPAIEDFSSRGPSNSGMTLPDLCGPDGILTYSMNSFWGTSAATPNVVGAAAALWSADPALDSLAVAWLLLRQSQHLQDWGPAGQDNTFGWGGGYLTDYAPNTLWIGRDFGNAGDLRQWPYYHVQAAHDAATSGGRLLVVPGASYPEPVTLTKNLTLEVLPGGTVIGN